MALTAEQESQVELARALEQVRTESQTVVDSTRHNDSIALESMRAKLEAVRLAKETLLENARSKPVDSQDITVEEITAFANVLHAYITT